MRGRVLDGKKAVLTRLPGEAGGPPPPDGGWGPLFWSPGGGGWWGGLAGRGGADQTHWETGSMFEGSQDEAVVARASPVHESGKWASHPFSELKSG